MNDFKQKKVGLVLHPYGEKYAAGLGRSIFRLAESIVSSDTSIHFVVYLKGHQSPDPLFKTSNFEIKRLPKSIFWLDMGLWGENKLDAYIFFTPFLPYVVKCPNAIVVVHDFAYRIIKPSSIREWLKRVVLKYIHGNSLRKAKEIVAVSGATRLDILKFYPHIKSEKVKVIYNGFDYRQVINQKPPEVEINQNFFLFVEVLKKRKNILGLIEAFELFKRKTGSGTLLVFAGKNGDIDIERKIGESSFKKDIMVLGYVEEEELAYLYQRALAFVYPSFIEGFGMPILEAMSLGIPVITSNIGATREIAGNAGYLVDPHSPEDIADALEVLNKDESKRAELKQKGIFRSQEFSWEKAGKEYVKVIKNSLN